MVPNCCFTLFVVIGFGLSVACERTGVSVWSVSDEARLAFMILLRLNMLFRRFYVGIRRGRLVG